MTEHEVGGQGQRRRRKDGRELGTRFYARPYPAEQPERDQKAEDSARPERGLARNFPRLFKENGLAFATWAFGRYDVPRKLVPPARAASRQRSYIATLRGVHWCKYNHRQRWFFEKALWRNFGKTPAVIDQAASELMAYDKGTDKDIPAMT